MLRAASEIKTKRRRSEGSKREEMSAKQKKKEKYGQFYNWALSTTSSWRKVKWLRAY